MPSFDDFGAPPIPKAAPQLSTRDRNLRASLASIPPSDDREDLTVANFDMLEKEIARAKDPKIRDILVTEHNRLKSQIHLDDDRSLTASKFKDFSEDGAPSPTMKALKAAGGEVAAVGDFLWGFFSMPIGVGADAGSRAYALGAGENRRIQAQAGREASSWSQEVFGNPFKKIIDLFDSGEAYEKAKTTQGMKWLTEQIDTLGKKVETATGGKILKEDVASLVDTLMVAGGTRGVAAAAAKPKFEPKLNLEGKPETGARKPGSREAGVEDAEIISEEPKPIAQPPMLPNKERGSLFDTSKDAARFSDADLKAIGMTRDQLKNELDRAVMPERMKFLAATAGAGALGLGGMALYDWMQEAGNKPADIEKYKDQPEPQPTEDGTLLAKAKDSAPWLLGPGIAMAGAVKGPGGMWHPEAVERLAQPLANKLLSGDAEAVGRGELNADSFAAKTKPQIDWTRKAIRNYLNKYAGTERDPLAGIELPDGGTWGEFMDNVIEKIPAREYHKTPGAPAELLRAPKDEFIHDIDPYTTAQNSQRSIHSYLSHVGDYLRQNVSPEKLQQYDLVRAVKETAENDKRVAKQMEKAQAASTKDLPVYKEYKDGFKWVELKLPEKLSKEQAKQVRRMTPAEMKEYKQDLRRTIEDEGQADPDEVLAQWGDDDALYTAIDAQNKPIINTYTKEPSFAATPEEAWLAGRLAEEGNSMGHCVGGYCEGVASGESRIFSLRDPKGKSHVTIEVGPQNAPNFYQMNKDVLESPAMQEFHDRVNSFAANNGEYIQKLKAEMDKRGIKYKVPPPNVPNIEQIKGKQNRAPNKEYLPYVQDFVRSGKWGEVGDFGHTGLYRLDMKSIHDQVPPSDLAAYRGHYPQLLSGIQKLINQGERYATKEDIFKAGGAEVPNERSSDIGPRNQRGQMTVGDAAKLTALGLGAAAGAYLSPDSPWFGAAVGAGSVLAAIALRKPDSTLRKEVSQALESMRRDVHPAFYADAESRRQAKVGEAIIASNIAKKMQHDSAVYHSSEGPRRLWEKLGPQKQYAFIRAFEKGQQFNDPTMKAMAERYSAWMTDLVQKEKGLGLDYEPREHYIYHSFEDAERLSAYFTKKYGPKWGDPSFTKDRQFDLYEEALKAGFKPKTLNPEHIMLNRQYASNIAEMRINILEDLRSQGLARLKGDERLATSSEVPRRAPNGKIYFVDPRADKILHNAFDTESLWARKDAVGAVFRAGMATKNTLVPLILNLSLFHPLHLILGMDNSAAMLRSIKKLNADAITPQQHFRDMFRAGNPISAIYDSVWTNPKAGWRPFQLWKGKVPENKVTGADREILQRTFEGGFIPEMGQEWKTKAIENFTRALDNKDLTAIPKFLLAMPQWLQKPLFEYWIPQLKYNSYLKDTEAALQANPKLRDDLAGRMVAFRKIAKSVENRYGEMAYSTLFWNRTLKDLGVLNALSLGWSLGFFREYGGGMREAGHGVINMTKEGKIARGEMDRALFVMLYTANTALYGGLITWALTGDAPTSYLDYFYPKTGEKKKDGTDARVNTMFYSREWLGMFKHMQNEGMLSGASQFMLNKLAPTWGISKGLWTNLDYFGKEISDPNSPAFQRLAQKLQWAMGEVVPISVQSIKKMDQPTAKNVALSIAGFSPAPRYATESPIEGKIASTYRQYHSAVTPYARAQRSDDIRELHQLKQAGDEEKFRLKLDAMRQSYGLTHAETTRLEQSAKVPPTERMFKGLTFEQQQQLLNTMNDDERRRFLPFANRKLKKKFEDQ